MCIPRCGDVQNTEQSADSSNVESASQQQLRFIYDKAKQPVDARHSEGSSTQQNVSGDG